MMVACVIEVFLGNVFFGMVSAARHSGTPGERGKEIKIYSLSELDELVERIESAGSHLSEELKDTSNHIERELKALKSTYAGAIGIMIRPAPGPITSSYSRSRIHPVCPHNSTGIGAPYGHEIYAADSGIVFYAGWYSGYGWTTILDHGNGLATVYAHQSKLAVDVGNEVAQGDVIGYVGSTGYSTGPHLHFEVRKYGELQDPYHYIPY